MMPWKAFELLFFAIFGQTDTASLQVHKIKPEQIRCPVIPTVPLLSTTAVAPLGSAKEVTTNMTTTTTPAPIFEPGQPEWTEKMFVVAFGIYQIVAVIVLINLLIAMMSDTYQRIQLVLSLQDGRMPFGFQVGIAKWHYLSKGGFPYVQQNLLCYLSFNLEFQFLLHTSFHYE
ncbi:hypothetical protein M8J75_015992 [Diaphorina citri]|nr:hypothetical protein M8J75_015992 [Diaphorina citri]